MENKKSQNEKKTIDSREIIEDLNECSDNMKNLMTSMNVQVILDKIKNVQKSLNEVKNMLSDIESSSKDAKEKVQSSISKLQNKTLEITRLNMKDVFDLIKDNLPDGVIGNQDGERCLKLETIKRTKKDKEKVLGLVNYIEEEDVKLKVLIYQENGADIKEDIFTLSSITRIYKIISYINNNVYYQG